mgnify:CR=1 FL=1
MAQIYVEDELKDLFKELNGTLDQMLNDVRDESGESMRQDMQADIDSANGRITELEASLERLQGRYDELESERDDLRFEVREIEKEAGRLERELANQSEH